MVPLKKFKTVHPGDRVCLMETGALAIATLVGPPFTCLWMTSKARSLRSLPSCILRKFPALPMMKARHALLVPMPTKRRDRLLAPFHLARFGAMALAPTEFKRRTRRRLPSSTTSMPRIRARTPRATPSTMNRHPPLFRAVAGGPNGRGPEARYLSAR